MKKFFKTLMFSFIMIFGIVLVTSCGDVPTELPSENHEHVLKEDKWLRDSATHWKECKDCDAYIDMGLHDYSEWEQSETECIKTRACKVCGFSQTQKDQHNYVGGICSICGKNEGDIEVVQYYVRGTAVGTWDATEENALVLDEKTYTATVTVHMEKDTEFKIADANWTDGYNFGYGNSSVTYDESLFGNKDGDNFLVLVSADYIITISGLDTDTHTITIVPSCIHSFGAGKVVAGKTCDYVSTCSNCGFERYYTEHYFEDSDLTCDLCGYYDFRVYYVKGNFNGYAANEDFKLNYDETTHTATIDLLLTPGHTFKIGTAEGWEFGYQDGTFPTGAFVSDADGNYMSVVKTPSGDDVLFTVTITGLNTINQNISITTEDDYVISDIQIPSVASNLYVKGSMNGWEAVEEYRLNNLNGVSSITVNLTAGDSFKIANEDYSVEYHLYSISCANGLFGASGDDAEKPNITVKTTGTYKVEISNNVCTISLLNGGNTENPGTSNLPVLYLKGTINGWAVSDDYKLQDVDGKLVIETALYANQEFKIADSNWNIEIACNAMNFASGLLAPNADEKPNAIVSKDGIYKITVSGSVSNLVCEVVYVSEIMCTSENGEHAFADATCVAPKTCSVCQYTIGVALGHVWDEGTANGTIIVYTCTRTGCEETKEVDSEVQENVYYLNAGGSSLWNQANAVFWVHVWDANGTSIDLLMTDENKDGIYEVVLEDGDWTNIIFVRGSDKTTTAGDWDKKWNQTSDLKLQDGKYTYTITGWGESDGSWS